MAKNLLLKRLSFVVILFVALLPSALVAKNLDPLSEVIDMQAQTKQKVTTPDGATCALVKVYTSIQRENLQFSTDMASTIELVDNSTMGQIWVYLSPGARQLTVRHSEFEESIAFARVVGGKVYKTKINYAPNIQYQQVVVNTSNYFTVTSNAPMSSISIGGGDEEPFNEYNTFSKSLDFGSYTYEISAPNYRPFRGEVTISAATGKVHVDAQLVANFKDLEIISSPELGVMVSLDGVSRGVTPLTISNVNCGEHTLRLQKSMYKIEEQTISVGYGGGVQQLNVALTPNFIESSIIVAGDSEAEIFMNGTSVGKGSYYGRIPLGEVAFEARKESYRTTYVEQNIEANANIAIRLDAPQPIYGILRVEESSGAPDVAIVINGKNVGTAPSAISDLLVGDYKVELVRSGYRTYERNVKISETQPVEIRAQLDKLVTGNTSIMAHSGAVIYDDSVEIGRGRYLGELSLGEHTIVVKDAFGSESKSLTVTSDGVARLFFESGDVTIRSDVGDKVSVDGNAIDREWSGPVLVGKYTLTSRSQQGDVIKRSIAVTNGKNESVNLQHYSTVTVTTLPVDANVKSSVPPIRREGNTFTMKPGRVRFNASKSRYYDKSEVLSLTAGQSYPLFLTMSRKPSFFEAAADSYYKEMNSRTMGVSLVEGAYSPSEDGDIGYVSVFNFRCGNLEFCWLGLEIYGIDDLMNVYYKGDLYDSLLDKSEDFTSKGDPVTTAMAYRCDMRYILPLSSWLAVTGSVGGSFSKYTNYGIAGAGVRAKASMFYVEGFYEKRGIFNGEAFGRGDVFGVRFGMGM